jgi:ribulose-5-phosphate 4-epimerase/fuculose-1-phosphate aldolase
MSKLDNLLNDLVIANRILANEDIVDAYGHVSVRHPDDPTRFFLARSLAPEFITRNDIVEFTLDGKPVKRKNARSISSVSSMAASSRRVPMSWRWCMPMPRTFCLLVSPTARL